MSSPSSEIIAVVTGGTAGIGFHAARQLAEQGATVLITGRNGQRGAEVAEGIAATAGHHRVGFLCLDHATIRANREVAGAVAEELGRLERPQRVDILVNNVGGIFSSRSTTADGIETTLALNFLAPYAVTRSLWDLLHRGPDSRCVNVVSAIPWLARQAGPAPLDDVQSTRRYVGIRAYARAKLFTAAVTLAWAADTSGAKVAMALVNPGTAWTPNIQSMTREAVPAWRPIWPVMRFFQSRGDVARAGRACLRVARDLAPADIDGRYFTSRGREEKLPALVRDRGFQRMVLDAAEALQRQAMTSGGAP